MGECLGSGQQRERRRGGPGAEGWPAGLCLQAREVTRWVGSPLLVFAFFPPKRRPE